jgi:hypothetical protein
VPIYGKPIHDPFSPARAGEKVPKADEGASAAAEDYCAGTYVGSLVSMSMTLA